MDIQRLVGVFTRILRRLCDVHLIKGDLVHAFAAQVFKADASSPDVAQRQAAQSVRFVHLQHVALQHGVVCVALHFDAVVGEDVAVVFEMLAQLLFRRVFQPRFELGQHLVARQLRGRTWVVVRERNVGGLARFDAEADAHDLGAHLVDGGRFGIHRRQLRSFNFGQPGVEAVPRHHRVVTVLARTAADGCSGLSWFFGLVKQARC